MRAQHPKNKLSRCHVVLATYLVHTGAGLLHHHWIPDLRFVNLAFRATEGPRVDHGVLRL